MAIDFKKMGFSKQTWVLLAVLVLAVGAAYYFTFPAATPASQLSVGVPTSNSGFVAGINQTKLGQTAPVVASAASAAGRDPFLVPVAYRQPADQSGLTLTAGTISPTVNPTVGPAVSPTGNGTAATPAQTIKLQGTVTGNSVKAAILSLGDKSQSVRVGEMIGSYTLLAVGKDYAMVNGPGGLMTLSMGR